MEEDSPNIDLDMVDRSNILQMFAVTEFTSPHTDKSASITNPTSVTTFKGSPAMVDNDQGHHRRLHAIPGKEPFPGNSA